MLISDVDSGTFLFDRDWTKGRKVLVQLWPMADYWAFTGSYTDEVNWNEHGPNPDGFTVASQFWVVHESRETPLDLVDLDGHGLWHEGLSDDLLGSEQDFGPAEMSWKGDGPYLRVRRIDAASVSTDRRGRNRIETGNWSDESVSVGPPQLLAAFCRGCRGKGAVPPWRHYCHSCRGRLSQSERADDA